jgi:ribonuclease R
LSENLCSLKAGEDRLAFIWRLKLDQSGNVVEEELLEGIIRVVKGYTYPEVDRYLAGESGEGEVDRQVLEWLFPLYRLTQTIRERRLKKGMTFISDEVRLKLDPAGEIAEVELERETPSHMLIEECMLLANQAAARIIDYGIFRVHPSPSATSLEELYSALESLGIRVDYDEKEFPKLVVQIQEQAEELGIRPFVDKLIIKAQQQAHYSAENSGHFALGFEKYTHFTSPIRRYSDLTLHRLLKAILKKDRRLTEYILRNIESLAVKISQLEREAQKVEWDFYDRKFARWAAKRIGERVEGVVEDPDIPPIARVTEQIPTARIFLENRERYPLFQRVQIEITDANIATAKIKGRVVEKLPSPHLPPEGEGEE